VTGGPDPLPDWHELAEAIPGITGPMRAYLEQIACVLALGVGGPLCSGLPVRFVVACADAQIVEQRCSRSDPA
jgi:hypothetical protein